MAAADVGQQQQQQGSSSGLTATGKRDNISFPASPAAALPCPTFPYLSPPTVHAHAALAHSLPPSSSTFPPLPCVLAGSLLPLVLHCLGPALIFLLATGGEVDPHINFSQIQDLQAWYAQLVAMVLFDGE